MEASKEIIKDLYEELEDYGLTSVKLAQLKGAKIISSAAPSLIIKLCVGVIACFFLIMLSAGLALMIGEFLGKIYLGFFIVAGFYLILGVLSHFFLFRLLGKNIGNRIIQQIFK
jgi:hypothetical protein